MEKVPSGPAVSPSAGLLAESGDHGEPADRRTDPDAPRGEGVESLKDAIQQALDEARMVLPGIQALFGFQLIAVFSDGFAQRLDGIERSLHLAAVMMVAVAVALIMTPAAYHRQANPRRADERFLELASNFVTAAMMPLALALSLDIYLVARVIAEHRGLAGVVAGFFLALLAALWFFFPRSQPHAAGGRL